MNNEAAGGGGSLLLLLLSQRNTTRLKVELAIGRTNASELQLLPNLLLND